MPSACNRSLFGRAGGSQRVDLFAPARTDFDAANAALREGAHFTRRVGAR
jgi:hypothetical protein